MTVAGSFLMIRPSEERGQPLARAKGPSPTSSSSSSTSLTLSTVFKIDQTFFFIFVASLPKVVNKQPKNVHKNIVFIKNIDVVLGIRTRGGHRMVGADGSTELWWPYQKLLLLTVFEPGPSGVGSDSSVNFSATDVPILPLLLCDVMCVDDDDEDKDAKVIKKYFQILDMSQGRSFRPTQL